MTASRASYLSDLRMCWLRTLKLKDELFLCVLRKFSNSFGCFHVWSRLFSLIWTKATGVKPSSEHDPDPKNKPDGKCQSRSGSNWTLVRFVSSVKTFFGLSDQLQEVRSGYHQNRKLEKGKKWALGAHWERRTPSSWLKYGPTTSSKVNRKKR